MSRSAPSRPPQGFALLALLLASVLAASGWLALGARYADDARAERAVRAGLRERRAADALMAHATLYADLYGPTGAGPGHLACPDRHRTPGAPEDPGRLPLAGPDPPCALRPAALGALPLHVNVGRLRAGIDPAPAGAAALAYRVEAAVVNNPLDRPVNDRTLPEMLGHIVTPGPRVGVPLRRRATGPAIRRRVAAWLVSRLDGRASLQGCAERPICSALQALGVASDRTALIDGVPASRHWFLRNDWAADFRIHVEAPCRPDPAACTPRIDRPAAMRIPSATPSGIPSVTPTRIDVQLVHAARPTPSTSIPSPPLPSQ